MSDARPDPGCGTCRPSVDERGAGHPGRGRRDLRPWRRDPPGQPGLRGARPGCRPGAGRPASDGPPPARAAGRQPGPGRWLEAVPRPVTGRTRALPPGLGHLAASTSAGRPTRRCASCCASWPMPTRANRRIQNPYWARIGYQPDRPALTERPTPIRALAVGRARPSTPTSSSSAREPAPASSPGSWPSPAARWSSSRPGRSCPKPEMPRNELAAFDRLYLDHGLTSTWDGSISILAGAGVGGGTTVNWMTCIDAPAAIRQEWTRDHGLAGFDEAEGDQDYAAIRGELGVTPAPRLPAKDAILVAGARALGVEVGANRSQRRRLHRVRLLSVRLPGRHEAIGPPGPPGRRDPARCTARGRRPGRPHPRRRWPGHGRRGDARLGPAADRPAGRGPAWPARADRPGAPGRAGRCRGPAQPGDPDPEWAQLTRRSDATCASIRCRSWPVDSPIRSRCGTA